MATDYRYLSIRVVRDRLNEHRRTEPIEEPHAVLNITTGKTVRSIKLDRRQLASLMLDAALANATLEKDR